MKKVLFYLHFLKMGGAEKVALEYINGLVEKGYKVDLIVDYDMGDENVFEKEVNSQVDIKYIKSRKVSNLIYSLRTRGKEKKFYNILMYILILYFDFYYYIKRVKPLMKKNKYDYTISFYQFLPSYLTKFKSTKHIIWLHGSVEHFFKGIRKYFKKSYQKKLGKYDYIVTIANEMKEQLIDFYPTLKSDKVKMIYNPFNFEEITHKSLNINVLNTNEKKLLNEKYICIVSRIDDNQKDIMTLIKAYKKLCLDNKIEEKLYIIGDGPDKKQFEEYVNKNGMSDQIKFLGKKENPFIWMGNSEIFVLSSKYEGLPTVLIEAMILGKYIISSKCKTGPTEILKNGKCGDLFEVGNDEELCDLIYDALNNKEKNQKKIELSKIRIKEFEKGNAINKLVEIMKSK